MIGLITGLVRPMLNVNSLIATLAMMLILQGSVYIYSMAAIYNTLLLPFFTFIGQGFVFKIPMPVIIMLFILPFFIFLLKAHFSNGSFLPKFFNVIKDESPCSKK